MVAFATIATTNYEPCNNMPNPRIRALLKSHKSASSIHLCASIRPFLLRCILVQTQTKIPDVIPCYFIVKCSGFVIHHINLSHVYGSGCCQMTEYARNSNVQVSFMKLVALSNYRTKDTSLLNI